MELNKLVEAFIEEHKQRKKIKDYIKNNTLTLEQYLHMINNRKNK
jgi:hypothetical protein